MSVLDRVRTSQVVPTDTTDQTSQELSSTQTLDNPVLRRLKIVVGELTSFSRKSDSKYGRYAWILESMLQELFEELDDRTVNEEFLGTWFAQFGDVIRWCGDGDPSSLPEMLHAYLLQTHPEEFKLAIAAGEPQ